MIRGADTFDVFVRDWWRRPERGEPAGPDNRVPYPGAPRRYLARGVSETAARDLCAEYAANRCFIAHIGIRAHAFGDLVLRAKLPYQRVAEHAVGAKDEDAAHLRLSEETTHQRARPSRPTITAR